MTTENIIVDEKTTRVNGKPKTIKVVKEVDTQVEATDVAEKKEEPIEDISI